MSRFLKIVFWLTVNSLFCYALWSALIDGSVNGGNILKFVIVVELVTSVMCCWQSVKGKRAIPYPVNAVLDILMALCLAYYGWFWYGGFKLVSATLSEVRHLNSSSSGTKI